MEGCPVELDHLGVVPALLGLNTFPDKLVPALLKLWVVGLAGSGGGGRRWRGPAAAANQLTLEAAASGCLEGAGLW